MSGALSLQGLTVLVTRPDPAGTALCAQIDALGGRALHLPTAKTVELYTPLTFQHQFKQLKPFDWVIFVSQSAVSYGLPLLRALWPAFPGSQQIAAVGASTAAALTAAGVKVTAYPATEWQSEGVLALPDFNKVQGQRIALVTGVGGRTLLQDTLTERAALVTRLEVYRRELPADAAEKFQAIFAHESIDVIVCTSNDILQNLIKLTTPATLTQLLQIPIAVISERMLMLAKRLGFLKVILIKNATHETVIAKLIQEKDRL